jgi:hypothetical protein
MVVTAGAFTKEYLSKRTGFYGTRHEYIPVGSTAASLPPTIPYHRVRLLCSGLVSVDVWRT